MNTRQIVRRWAALAGRVPHAVITAARVQAAKHYRQLQLRHGPAMARQAALEALLDTALPLPHEPSEATACHVAVAELLEK